MSAIFGILHRDGKPVARDDLGRMDAALEAFGPDGHGIWSDGHVGLGQREMHFTPEDRFNQLPLKSADGLRVLVCDARVDNRPELMHLLDIRPTDAKEMPDSAFIMRAYEKWGQDCAKYLIGDIAFAMWDQREQHLLLARSPVGGRSMYYYSSPDLFAFSSMPKGLFAIPYIPRELDLEHLAIYLTMTGPNHDKSFYHDIKKLLPGQISSVRRYGVQRHTFWQAESFSRRELHLTHDDEYVDAFNELFERVVADHLRSLTPVGVMMSGGLDSTSVAAVAASQLKKTGKRLATFTEVPRSGFSGPILPGRYADETPYVQSMARHYDNLDLNLISTHDRIFLNSLERFFDASDLPFRNSTNQIWYEAILQKARSQGIQVFLNGGMGNITISRNGQSRLPQLLRSGRICKAIFEASALHKNNTSSSTLRLLIGQGVIPLLPNPVLQAVQKLRRKQFFESGLPSWHEHSAINPVFADLHHIAERVRKREKNLQFRPGSDQRDFFVQIIANISAATSELNHSYRALYGMEKRDPTSDVRLVEFCLALPEEQYHKGGISRRLIRRAMENKLPAEVLENKERGLQSADWFECLFASRERIMQTLTDLNQSTLVSSALDLKRMQHLAQQLHQPHKDARKQMAEYQLVLGNGLMIGSFIRWFERGGKNHAN